MYPLILWHRDINLVWTVQGYVGNTPSIKWRSNMTINLASETKAKPHFQIAGASISVSLHYADIFNFINKL